MGFEVVFGREKGNSECYVEIVLAYHSGFAFSEICMDVTLKQRSMSF